MSPSTFNRQRLLELIREHALKFGDFTLASGKKATYYLDCRKLTLDSEGANVIAAGILDAIGDDLPEAVGGMAIGADPITAAVITCAWQQNKPLKGARRIRTTGFDGRRCNHHRRQFTQSNRARSGCWSNGWSIGHHCRSRRKLSRDLRSSWCKIHRLGSRFGAHGYSRLKWIVAWVARFQDSRIVANSATAKSALVNR